MHKSILFCSLGAILRSKMDVTENVSLIGMVSLKMNRLVLSKDFTDADQKFD